jgi:hypothetical protein
MIDLAEAERVLDSALAAVRALLEEAAPTAPKSRAWDT